MVFVGFEPTSTSNGNRICSRENWMTCVSSWCFFSTSYTRWLDSLYECGIGWCPLAILSQSWTSGGLYVCYIYVHFTHVYSYHILLGLFLLCKTPIHKFLTVSTYCHPPRNLSKLILTISPGFSGELRCYCHNWRPKPWRCPPKLGRLEILVNLTDFFSLNTLRIILQKKVWTKCLYMDLSQMTHRQ